MNYHTEHPTKYLEMMRRITFICLAVVVAILVYHGTGGSKVISRGLCRVQGFAETEAAVLTDTAQRYGEHVKRLEREIQALLRALSCIQQDLSNSSQPPKAVPLTREATPTNGASAPRGAQWLYFVEHSGLIG